MILWDISYWHYNATPPLILLIIFFYLHLQKGSNKHLRQSFTSTFTASKRKQQIWHDFFLYINTKQLLRYVCKLCLSSVKTLISLLDENVLFSTIKYVCTANAYWKENWSGRLTNEYRRLKGNTSSLDLWTRRWMYSTVVGKSGGTVKNIHSASLWLIS